MARLQLQHLVMLLRRYARWLLTGLVAVPALVLAAKVASHHQWRWSDLTWPAIIAAVALIVGLIVWALVMPGRLAPAIPASDLAQIIDPKARLDALDARLRLRHDLRVSALQLLTVIAVLAGATLGYQQLAQDRSNSAADRRLTRQGQASQRFTQAISQLGNPRVETRIGGIYGLAQIARQAPDNMLPVGEVLLAWVNHQPRQRTSVVPLQQRAPDLQAARSVLATYDLDSDGLKDHAWLADRLELHELDLNQADLFDAFLAGVVLNGADLSGANLSSAYLGGAHFSRARLSKANLDAADFIVADLTGADLRGANLSRANLDAADLRGADLNGADLRGADLNGADLMGADADRKTRWPTGFDWRRAGVDAA